MRLVSVLAILASSVSLAACGGGGASSLLNGTSTSSASSLGVCGVNGTAAECIGTHVTLPTTPIPPITPSTVGSGGTNTGNTTSIATGDTTLILEKSILKSAIETPGLSKLTVQSAPNKAMIAINTRTANNGAWPVPKLMNEFLYGTNYDSTAVATRNMGGTYKEYHRLYYNNTGERVDEELQVWNWSGSTTYATQYRVVTNGGEAGQQAWSFGGTKTAAAAMPTTGIVNYNTGRFVATAKTSNFEDVPSNGQTVSFNNLWRVTGAATATANFGTGAVHVDLAPEVWVAWASLNGASGFTPVSSDQTSRQFWTPPTSNPAMNDPNWANFMDDHVFLDGKLTSNVPGTGGAPATTGAATGNNSTDSNYVTGTASYEPNSVWVTNESVNPFYAAFFGAAANEMTGSFALEAVTPQPGGGDLPINDDRRGFITMSGIFHVQQ